MWLRRNRLALDRPKREYVYEIPVRGLANMHMAVVWSINNFDKNREISEQIIAILAPYERVQIFPYAYIIKIPDVGTANKVSNALVELATTWGNAFNIITTPPIIGGRYAGRMSVSLWPEINRLTDEVRQ
jgi:hypothetical protein